MLNYIGIKSAMLWVKNQDIAISEMVVVGRSAMVCADIIRTCHQLEVAVSEETAIVLESLGGEVDLNELGLVTRTVHVTPKIAVMFITMKILPTAIWNVSREFKVAKDPTAAAILDTVSDKALTEFNAGGKPLEERTKQLRVMYRGYLDIQRNRIRDGNRLVAAFKHRLGLRSSEDEKDIQKGLKLIVNNYKLLTDGVVSITASQFKKQNQKLRAMYPQHGLTVNDVISDDDVDGLTYDDLLVDSGDKNMDEESMKSTILLIDDYTELLMIRTYMEQRDMEASAAKRIKCAVEGIPIWDNYLQYVKGCGPISAAAIISGLNIEAARYPSSFWRYLGLDVTLNKDTGELIGRRAYKSLMEKRPRLLPDGKVEEISDLGYNPSLKSKILFIMGGSMVKAGGYYKQEVYDPYKARISQRPDLMDVEIDGKVRKMGLKRGAWANRYMIKQFLADLFVEWKLMSGGEVPEPYEIAKLGQKAHSRRYFRECLALAKLNGGSPEDYMGPVTGSEPKVAGIHR